MAFIILLVLIIVILAASLKVVKEYERMAVFRLGRFVNIVGPGLVLLIPGVDKGVKVNVKEKIPGWQTLSQKQLEERIKQYVLYESRINP
jgi:regulator of protease activity HflC (stomatin/prohibitin superfamily)